MRIPAVLRIVGIFFLLTFKSNVMLDFEVKIAKEQQREFWERLSVENQYKITWMNKQGLYQFRNVDESTFKVISNIVSAINGEILNKQECVLNVLFPE